MQVRLILQRPGTAGLTTTIVEVPDTLQIPCEGILYGDDHVIINKSVHMKSVPITDFKITGVEFLYPEA